MRRESHVHKSVLQQQTGTLIFPLRIEGEFSTGTTIARSRNGRSHYDRPAKFFCSRSDIERMQPQEILSVF